MILNHHGHCPKHDCKMSGDGTDTDRPRNFSIINFNRMQQIFSAGHNEDKHDNTQHTTYQINTRLCPCAHFIINDRGSDMRALHQAIWDFKQFLKSLSYMSIGEQKLYIFTDDYA